MKKFLIIIGIVVVLLVGALAILAANLGKVVASKKDYILEKAETALGRDVAIDDIGVTIGRGIGVKLSGVTIADDPAYSNEPFVAAKDLTVRVKLLPLIKKQVEVKRLVLNDPVINVIRDENGVFNFASMTQAAGGTDAGDAAAELEPAETAAAGALALAFADVKNGTLRYVDRQQGVELEVGHIDFTAKDAALGKEASVDFKAAILADDQNVHVEGNVGPIEKVDAPEDLKPTPLNLTVSFEGLTADRLKRVIPDHPALAKLDLLELGAADASLTVTGTLGALELTGIELTAAVLGSAAPNLSFRGQTLPFDAMATGDGGVPAVGFSGRLEAKPLPLAKLREKAAAAGQTELPEELRLSGDAAFAVEFDGTPESISLEADIDLNQATVQFGEQFNKPAGVPMGLTSRLSVDPEGAKIDKCTVTAGGLVLQASGTVDFAGEAPDIDITVKSAPTDIAAVAGMLPALEPFSLAGTMGLVARARGVVAPGGMPKVEGTLELKNGGAKLVQMPQPVTGAVATVSFTEKSARVEKASAKVGRSAVHLTANATSLKPMKATYRVWSDEVYRADFNASPKPADRPELLKDVEVKGTLSGEGDNVQLQGTATSAAGTLANVDYSDMKASIGSSPDRVDINSFSAKALGGTVEGEGAFVTSADPPRFEVTTRVRSVNLTQYFTYKVKGIQQFIDGTIDLDLNLAGTGKEWEAVKPTLTGGGGGVVVRGALLNVNIANDLLSGLERELEQLPLIDRSAFDRVRQKNPKMFSSNNSAFKDLRGDIRVENGRVHSKGLVLKSSDYEIFGDGWVSFDSQMHLNTTIVFSTAATQNLITELKALEYLTNDRGQLVLPVSLTGPLTKPGLGFGALAKQIQDAAIDTGVEKLKDQLGDIGSEILKGFGKKKEAKKDTTKTP